jgi:hypothetical protein
MSDRAWTRIEIGGKASRSTLTGLLAVEGCGLNAMLKAPVFSQRELGQYEGLSFQAGILVLEVNEQAGGCFSFEPGLVEAQIAFDRMNDPYPNAWGYNRAVFRPGMPAAKEWEANCEYEPVVRVAEVRTRLEKERSGDLYEWLAAEFPPVPELEPLELVE